jgi:hypothetical protein
VTVRKIDELRVALPRNIFVKLGRLEGHDDKGA